MRGKRSGEKRGRNEKIKDPVGFVLCSPKFSVGTLHAHRINLQNAVHLSSIRPLADLETPQFVIMSAVYTGLKKFKPHKAEEFQPQVLRVWKNNGKSE